MRHARSDRLDQQPQRLAGDGGKAFDAQHVEFLRQRGDARGERGRIGDFAERHDEGIEIVVIVLFLGVVPGAAVVDVVFGADAKPEQQRLIDLAVGDGDHLHAARQHAGDRRQRLVDAGGVDQIALVEHDEIGAGDLILEHFLDRIVVRRARCRRRAAAPARRDRARRGRRPAPRRRRRRRRRRR